MLNACFPRQCIDFQIAFKVLYIEDHFNQKWCEMSIVMHFSNFSIFSVFMYVCAQVYIYKNLHAHNNAHEAHTLMIGFHQYSTRCLSFFYSVVQQTIQSQNLQVALQFRNTQFRCLLTIYTMFSCAEQQVTQHGIGVLPFKNVLLQQSISKKYFLQIAVRSNKNALFPTKRKNQPSKIFCENPLTLT